MVEVILLLAAGVVFALLFLLVSLIRTLSRKEKITFLDLFLAFLVTILLVAALINNYLGDTPLTALPYAPPIVTPERVVGGVGAVIAVFGLVFAILEMFRPQGLKGSRGILAVWMGLLLAVSTFTVPIAAQQFKFERKPPQLLAESGAVITEEVTADPNATPIPPTRTPTPEPTLTPSPTRTPTMTRTPRPSATFTSTRYTFATRTPEPTATLPNPCLAMTLYNLRLRAAPNAEAETLVVIPFNTNVAVFGRNQDSTWWFTEYEGQSGWVDGQYMQITAACNALPVRGRSG